MNPIQQKQLSKIATETDSATGYSVVKQASADKLASAGFIEIAPAGKVEGLEAGTVAARITQAGRDAVSQPATAPAGKPSFSIEAGALPEVTRAGGGGRESVYPFDELAAPTQDGNGNTTYAQFRVNDADVASGDAAKSLGSSVSSANKRYSTEGAPVLDANGQPVKGRGGHAKVERTYSRRFKVFRVEGGAIVARVQ